MSNLYVVVSTMLMSSSSICWKAFMKTSTGCGLRRNAFWTRATRLNTSGKNNLLAAGVLAQSVVRVTSK